MTKKLLTLKDIEIKNVGQQVRNAILKDYSSIESFYQRHNIQKPKFNSFKSYLSSDEVSESFQILIVNTLEKDWKEIVKTEEEQMRQHVQEITENIGLYNKENDLTLLLKLKIQSKTFRDLYATMYRNIGLYHYNTHKYNDAVTNIMMAIELVDDIQNNNNLLIMFYTDLLTIYFRERVFDRTMSLYNKILPIVSSGNIDKNLLYDLWYILGQLFMNGKDDEDNIIAKTMFEKSLKYAATNNQKGRIYLQKGILCKNESDYTHALKYYELAQEVYEKDDYIRQSIVLNNLAELYRVQGIKYRALLYIEEALYLTNKEGITDKKLMYLTTKLEIVEDKSVSHDIILEIGDILLSDIYNFNKKFIITSLNAVIKVIEKTNDEEIIKSLVTIIEKIIMQFSNESNNQNSFLHDDFVKLLENSRNKLIYLYNKNKEVVV